MSKVSKVINDRIHVIEVPNTGTWDELAQLTANEIVNHIDLVEAHPNMAINFVAPNGNGIIVSEIDSQSFTAFPGIAYGGFDSFGLLKRGFGVTIDYTMLGLEEGREMDPEVARRLSIAFVRANDKQEIAAWPRQANRIPVEGRDLVKATIISNLSAEETDSGRTELHARFTRIVVDTKK